MLLDAFAQYPGLATRIDIQRFEHSATTYLLVARVTLKDESKLFLRDYLFPDGSNKYAYHWQSASGELLGRWDNAPHWREVATFPHHHHPPDGTPEPSDIRRLADLIDLVAQRLGVVRRSPDDSDKLGGST